MHCIKFFSRLALLAVGLCLNVAFISAQAQTTIVLPDGEIGIEYKIKVGNSDHDCILAIEGGKLPFQFALTTSSATKFPKGIEIKAIENKDGTAPAKLKISGKPEESGDFNPEIEVIDANNRKFVFKIGIRIADPNPLSVVFAPPAQKLFDPSEDAPAAQQKAKDVERSPGSNSDSLTISVANEFKASDLIYKGAEKDKDKEKQKDRPVSDFVNFEDGTLIAQSGSLSSSATALIHGFVESRYQLGLKSGGKEEDVYCIISIVKWKASAGEPAKFDSTPRWYLFQRAKDGLWEQRTEQEGSRIYGSKQVAVLLLHLNARNSWDIRYAVKTSEKIPMPVQNALELISFLGPKAKGDKKNVREREVNFWAAQMLTNINNLPADVSLAGSFSFVNSEGKQTQQPKEDKKTFDNEKRYHWDVSVGFPFSKLRQIEYQFSQDPTKKQEGTVVTRKTDRQNAYAFLNLFFDPRGVDLKKPSFLTTPHLVFGVPFTGKPLDRPMVGVGTGIYQPWLKINVFAGAVFNRVEEPRTLSDGDTTTSSGFFADLHDRRVTKLIFGINIPISQARAWFKK